MNDSSTENIYQIAYCWAKTISSSAQNCLNFSRSYSYPFKWHFINKTNHKKVQRLNMHLYNISMGYISKHNKWYIFQRQRRAAILYCLTVAIEAFHECFHLLNETCWQNFLTFNRVSNIYRSFYHQDSPKLKCIIWSVYCYR